MGWAIAEAARLRGADVTVLASNVELPRRHDIAYADAATAADLRRATLDRFPDADLLVMAAAVADYRPAAPSHGKIDKAGAAALTVDLERTADILSEVSAARRPGQVLVGFSAEAGPEGLARAREKRERKRVDLIVHNDVGLEGIGFGSEDNQITIIGPGDREQSLPRLSKAACAGRILDAAGALLAGPPAA
jgi:phosphopantothenoylcysteine decarboxylase/phosphopantothenate--cysteine ligase